MRAETSEAIHRVEEAEGRCPDSDRKLICKVRRSEIGLNSYRFKVG